MSFDLGVWYSDRLLTVDEAGELYVKLCEQTWIPIEEHASEQAFYDELCSVYPEIDTLPEENVDECPWSCAHDRSGFHVLIAMSYGERTSAVAQFIVDLAKKHNLICYDPQGPDVYLPGSLKPKISFSFLVNASAILVLNMVYEKRSFSILVKSASRRLRGPCATRRSPNPATPQTSEAISPQDTETTKE